MTTPLHQQHRPAQGGRPRLRSQTGSSLLEVLVAVLIVSFGVLGLVGLQAKATSMSIAAEDRTRAALLANEYVSTMQVLRRVLDATELAALQKRADISAPEGLTDAPGGLPGGEFVISEIDDNTVAITVQWTPINAQDGATSQYTTVAVVSPVFTP